MSDYNDEKLVEPCLRLPYGGAEYASVELGDGTGYVRFDWYERLESENARLRGFADEVAEFVSDVDCRACAMKRHCADNGMIACHGPFAVDELRRTLRAIGIEVDG